MMNFLSLFAGIGGFDLGLERAGMTCVGQCEIDPFCQKVLAKHWPKVWRHGDIKTLTKELCDEHCGRIDIICGGFPCQDISLAGNRAGIEGDRSGLWSEYARIISEIRPRFAVVENVSALLIPTEFGEPAPIARVLGDLAAIGYDAEWDCIPACAVGAPHERDRVWIVAYPTGQRFTEKGKLRYRKSAQRISSGSKTAIPANAWEKRKQRIIKGEVQRFPAFSWCEDVRGVEDLRGRSDLHPSFAELAMGFPIGWTVLLLSETPSSRKSPNGSDGG